MTSSQKQAHSPTYSPVTPVTPSKKFRVLSPNTPGKERPVPFVNRVLKSSLYPVSTHVRPRHVKYLLEYKHPWPRH